ncbi:MAG: hypothetical protein Q4G59_05525, partial [Planctomycetia bacterium]|nr:hypothetical protein [Planctomycetia bacterium]
METLTQKQTCPIAPGILLVLVVLACLRAVPILAQESSLLLPQRQPSELLLPALESALFQPTRGSSSFLKSQSFEVREAARQHKAGLDNAPRRLKSAASTPNQTQTSPTKTQTPFPTVGVPLAAQKPVVPNDGQNATASNTTAFKEVLQYDATGLFALKLVRIPVLNETAVKNNAATTSPEVNLPPFLVSAGKTAMPISKSDVPAPANSIATQLPKTATAPSAINTDKSTQNRREGAALAAIGTAPKSATPAAVTQKTNVPAVNPLLVLPSNHPSAASVKAPVAADQSPVKKIQPQTATASKGAPVPTLKSNSFDLGSAAMEYVSGGSIPDEKNPIANGKPIPSIESDKESPWFARLPKDDFLIGFDNEEEIGLAQSHVFLGPNGEVRELPPQTKHVSLPPTGMTLPKEMQAAGTSEETPDTTNASRPELIASLPISSSAPQQMAPPTATPVPLPSAPEQKEHVAEQAQPEKADFLAKLSFGKINLGSKTTKAEKAPERKKTERKANRIEKETKETPVRKPEYAATDAPSGKSVTSLFSGLNPFSKKKT